MDSETKWTRVKYYLVVVDMNYPEKCDVILNISNPSEAYSIHFYFTRILSILWLLLVDVGIKTL